MSLRLGLEGARPNPAQGAIRAWFTLPSPSAASLEVLDIQGRRVVKREVGLLGPGQHMLTLGSSAHMRPGLYFLRLTQGGHAITRRVVLTR